MANRAAAPGAGVGDEDVADPIQAVLPRREAEPPRPVHQSRGGELGGAPRSTDGTCERQ